MADYVVLNGQSIYTKDSIDQQMNRVSSAIEQEAATRQNREDAIESNLSTETARREQGDGELDVRVSSLERYIGPNGIRDKEGNIISIPDFYEEFLKEVRDRRSEDENIEAEFEKYLKWHGPQELYDTYEKLKSKPWIAFRDGDGHIRIKEIAGTKEHPFDLTDLYTLTTYPQLKRKPWVIFKNTTGRVVCRELLGGKENALDLTEFAKVNDYDTLVNRPWFKYVDADGQVQLVEIVGGQDSPVDLTKFAGVTNYEDLQNHPFIKYKDASGTVHVEELHGGEGNAIDLTELSGTVNYNKLQNAPTINGTATQNTGADIDTPKDIVLATTIHKHDDDSAYDEGALLVDHDVPVHELELTALANAEIDEMFED